MELISKHMRRTLESLPFLQSAFACNDEQPDLYTLSHAVSGPVLFSYVWWILKDAQEKGISRLYFMARDGHILLQIAKLFCRYFHLNVECRYLFASRASLRMPTYHFIGNEAYDLLFMDGYRVTLRTLMNRAGFSESERMQLYQACGFNPETENRPLNLKSLNQLKLKLTHTSLYTDSVNKLSKNAFESVAGYLRQEKLMDGTKYAIVDSGWMGSVQRSLRQILEHCGYQTEITGYYFGLFSLPPSADGTFCSWYFSHNSGARRKISFCNNLFECMLSAPHGSTNSYFFKDGHYYPVLSAAPAKEQCKAIRVQQDAVLHFVKTALPLIAFSSFPNEQCTKAANKLLNQLMGTPTVAMVEAFHSFLFSDDISEDTLLPLAAQQQLPALKSYFLVTRIARKLKRDTEPELFWPCGTTAYLPPLSRYWYRANIYAWNALKYLIKSSG